MAKRKINKPAAVRKILEQNPKMKGKEIVAQLAEKGVKVSANQVYFVKAKMKELKRKLQRQRMAETTKSSGVHDPVGLILKVRSLAHESGGIRNLKKLVDLLAE